MYLANAPQADGPADAVPVDSTVDSAVDTGLRLRHVVGRTFEPVNGYEPAITRFFADLASMHGRPRPASDFATVPRTTFTEMVTGVVDELSAFGPVDLVVLAHSTPDAEPLWPGTYLSSALPGEPHSFAIADQGVTAPFTALRLAGDYTRADGFQRVLVIAVDQTRLDAEPGTPLPSADRLVALVLERAPAGERGIAVGLWPDVAADAAPTAVRAAIRGTAIAVLGGELAARSTFPPRVRPVAAPAGQPCTGVWSAMTTVDLGGHPVVVADYDPVSRHLAAARIR